LKETSSKATGVTYTITGVIEEVADTKLKITELPVRRWTTDYKEFLESMCPIPIKEKEKSKDKNKEKKKDKDKDKDKEKEKSKEPPLLEVVNSANSSFSWVSDVLTYLHFNQFTGNKVAV
jgi:hypothetical protein